MNDEEFKPFHKIARLRRDVVVTEKIDGTNAHVLVTEDGRLFAGSRNRWLTPEDDNFGFAAWVMAKRDELLQLGPGRHYGEWWGPGINRGYGMRERRFSLFNVGRWNAETPPPGCCYTVPTLGCGPLRDEFINACLVALQACGSLASPGFMRPEGIVIFHTSSRQMYKVTLEDDEIPKSKTKGEKA